MVRLYQRVGRILDRREIDRPHTATIYEINGDRVDIRIANASNIIHYVPVVGDISTLQVGDTVNIQWVEMEGSSGYRPVVLSLADQRGGSIQTASEIYPDNVTIEYSTEGLRVKLGSLALSHLNFAPALEGHVHEDSLSAHGWQIDDNGTIFAQATFIHSDGQISLGLAPDIIKLDAMHPTYRIWAGAVDPAAAPFSVTKEGALKSTSGYIGGWLIGATSLSSDNGNASINSSVPSIALGATSLSEGDGFWVGKDTVYKLRIGAVGGNVLTWDGSDLLIVGSVRSADFASGATGWSITDTGDAEFNDVTVRGTLRSTVFEYNEIQATAGTLGVYTNAGLTAAQFTAPSSTGSVSISIETDTEGVYRFAIGDYVYIRTYTGGSIKTLWGNVTACGTIGNGVYTLAVNMTSGSWSSTFPAGTVVVNFGPSGRGFITLSADYAVGKSPNISLMTHSGTTSWNLWTRIGNLRNSYGYGDTADVWGAAFGPYANSKSFITVDTDNGIRILKKTDVGVDVTVARWYNTGEITIGEYASGISNINLSSNSIKLRTYSTVNLELTTAGVLNIGNVSSGEYLTVSTAGIEMFSNAIKVVDIDTNGDFIFGQVATDKSNLFWDQDQGRLNFRGSTNGTVVSAYIDTDGSIVAGGGGVKINSSGISVAAQDSWTEAKSYSIKYGATTVLASIWGEYTAGNTTHIDIKPVTGKSSNLKIDLLAPTGYSAYYDLTVRGNGGTKAAVLELYANDTLAYSRLAGGGVIIGTTTPNSYYEWSTTPGALAVSGNTYIGGGAHIGAVNTTSVYTDDLIVDGGISVGRAQDSSAGDITYTGKLYSYKNSAALDVYGYHPVTGINLSAFFNGTARSNTGRSLRYASSASDWGSLVPTGARAILVRVCIRDSGSAASLDNTWVHFGQLSTSYEGTGVKCNGITNDAMAEGTIIIPLGASEAFYWQCTASGTGTLDVWAWLVGYFY